MERALYFFSIFLRLCRGLISINSPILQDFRTGEDVAFFVLSNSVLIITINYYIAINN